MSTCVCVQVWCHLSHEKDRSGLRPALRGVSDLYEGLPNLCGAICTACKTGQALFDGPSHHCYCTWTQGDKADVFGLGTEEGKAHSEVSEEMIDSDPSSFES